MDAMKDGGRMRLRVVRAHEWSNKRRDGVRITIADTGNGIQARDLPHIFEPFYTTKQATGTGLGLWLTDGLVPKPSGWIKVASRTRPSPTRTGLSVFFP